MLLNRPVVHIFFSKWELHMKFPTLLGLKINSNFSHHQHLLFCKIGSKVDTYTDGSGTRTYLYYFPSKFFAIFDYLSKSSWKALKNIHRLFYIWIYMFSIFWKKNIIFWKLFKKKIPWNWCRWFHEFFLYPKTQFFGCQKFH